MMSFFFSSRRRHTRWPRDWSSDVCSSDLSGVNFLGDPNLALVAIILVTVWKNIGYFLVIYYAGIQAIPAELYEASAVDGASRIQRSEERRVGKEHRTQCTR